MGSRGAVLLSQALSKGVAGMARQSGGGERAPRDRSGRVNAHLGVQRPLRQHMLQLADQVVLAEGGLRITAGQQLVPRIIYATIFQ